MVVSQNGWTANNRTLVSKRNVPGTDVYLTVRNGVAGDLLLWVASEFDRLVESIDNGRGQLDDWGYAERPIRGGVETSNHASGTAIDLNAPRHPLGAVNTFNLAQQAAIRQILRKASGAVRWGGDYAGRKDDMHFEINTSEAGCQAAWNRIHATSKKGQIEMLRLEVPPKFAFSENISLLDGDAIVGATFEWTDSSGSIPSLGGGTVSFGGSHGNSPPVRLWVEFNSSSGRQRQKDVWVGKGHGEAWLGIPKGCYGISVARIKSVNSDETTPVSFTLMWGYK